MQCERITNLPRTMGARYARSGLSLKQCISGMKPGYIEEATKGYRDEKVKMDRRKKRGARS